MNLNFAENLKRLRKEKGLTQEKVADALCVTSQSISRWELGICYPDIEFLPSIANFFGVTVDSLLSNDIPSKEADLEAFIKKYREMNYSPELIEFAKNYCQKYPDNNYYKFQLAYAIKNYVIGEKDRNEKYMPLMLKTVESLLETHYRNAVIEMMASVCNDDELDRWLDMAPYSAGFSRRSCLLYRSYARGGVQDVCAQLGIKKFEVMAEELDARYPDIKGAEKKAAYHLMILRTLDSFGEEGVPDGWRAFYAYKQLVFAACLFGQNKVDDGWWHFESAIEKCKCAYACSDEWLDVGGAMFSDIKVNRSWRYALDAQGNKHRLFATERLSFCDMKDICDLLENTRWSWFDSVRKTEKFKHALEWVRDAKKKYETEQAKDVTDK